MAKVKEEVKQEAAVYGLERTWNTFASRLVSTKLAWEEHRKAWLEIGAREIEKLDPAFQRFLSKNFNRSEFDIMLPRLVDFYRGYGGIESLVVKTKKEK